MKNVFLSLVMIVFVGQLTAQENNVTYKSSKKQTEITTYYDNGQVKEHGFFNKEGALDGNWVQYDEAGNVMVQGEYADGMKVGKWLFWKGDTLKEVDFQANKIVKYNQWSKTEYLAVH